VRQRDRVTIALGAVALGVAVLVVGGALRWTQAAVAIATALALAFQLTSRRAIERVSPLVLLTALPLGLTLLQLVPLPAGLVEQLEPGNAVLRQDGPPLLGATAWSALTMDVAGTLRAAAFFTILLGVAVVALRFAASERGRFAMLATVAGLCGLTAVIVGVHEVVGAEALYGLYVPTQATPPILGPLLNPNHLGCLMAVGAVLSVGLLLHHRQANLARAGWALCGAACTATAMASLSRGAVLALGVGLAVTITTWLTQRLVVGTPGPERGGRRHRRRFLIRSLPLGIVVVCGLILVVYTSGSNVTAQLGETSLQELHDPRSKFAAWSSATAMIEEAPWTGVGRGAFEPAFTRVHPASAFITASHLENEYLQVIVDWGIPAALVLGAATVWFLLVAIRRWRDGPLAAAAFGALTVVAVQSNVDFAVELLGLAVPVTIIAATLVYMPLRPAPDRRERVVGMTLRGLLVAGLGGAALILCLPMTTTVAEDHLTLARRDDLSDATLQAIVARHPLDYLTYAVAAERAIGRNEKGAIRLLNHALRLHPTHPGLHRLAGRLLLRNHYDTQATIEYATALRGTMNPRPLLAEIVAAFPKAELAAAAIPADYANVDGIVRGLDEVHRLDVATLWLRHVLVLRPRELTAIKLLRGLVTATGDVDAAIDVARRQVELEASTDARLALARLLFKAGKYDELRQLLADVAEWHGRSADIMAGWLLLCDALAKLDDPMAAEHCLRRLDVAGIVPPSGRGEVSRRLTALDPRRVTPPVAPPPPGTMPKLPAILHDKR
jgi:O-antigen ligase